MKQRYLKAGHKQIPVTEDVYLAAARWKENERYRARRDGRCGQPNYRRCSGDCGMCPWQQEGFRMLSFAKAFGDDFAMEPPEPSSPGIEEIVAGKLLLEKLYRALDALIPDGARVFRMSARSPERWASRRNRPSTAGSKKWTPLSAPIGRSWKIC